MLKKLAMKNKYPYFNYNLKVVVILLGLNILFYSCSDIIEQNISNKQISILAPTDGYKTSISTQVFWWDELKGAEKYNLQIVRPGFSSIQNFILDTNVIGNKYTCSLVPGTYQWRIKGVNNGSSTEYITRTLIMDSIIDLTNQIIILSSPDNNFISNILSHTFEWDKLYNAADYQFQIKNKNNSNYFIDTLLKDNSFVFSLYEGAFTWKVRAKNASSMSEYSSHSITIDITPPDVSTLDSPIHVATANNPVALTWTRDASAIADSLFIYTDSLVSTPVSKLYLTTTIYNYTGKVTQIYFWRLRSADAAGNWSGYSTARKFKVM